jgi:hypothetical protein
MKKIKPKDGASAAAGAAAVVVGLATDAVIAGTTAAGVSRSVMSSQSSVPLMFLVVHSPPTIFIDVFV